MARNTSAWGLDVGNTSLKAMKLRREGDGVAIEAFDVVEHDKFLTEPDVDQDETIRRTLAKFLERNPMKGEMVFIGVPGSKTFARFVKLPPVEPKKIPEIVKFEAIQQIPFPLEQVNWDYQTFTNPESPEVEVGIFAMKKELVAQVMNNFTANNMVVQGVQMSPLAVYNAAVFDEMTGGKGTVILDIGAEHTDLIFIDQGRLWLRTINIGGNAFTDALSKSFKVSFAKGESLKKTAATSKYAKQIFQAMRPVFADLVAEIQRSIGFYNSSHRDSRLERIIGMGNPFKLPNLQKYIQQELKMEVVRLEGFHKAVVDGKLAAGLQEHALAMSGAYGLALQGLDIAAIDTNLLPTDIARAMVWRAKRPWFYGAAAAIALATLFSGVMYWNQSSAFAASQEKSEKADNERAIQDAQKSIDTFKRIPDTAAHDGNMVKSLLALSDQRRVWPSVLQDIFDSLPQSKRHAGAPGPTFVITQVRTKYATGLSTVTTPATSAGGGVTAAEGDAPDLMGTTGAMPTAASPATDRGFVVTITGYIPPQENRAYYTTLDEFKNAVVARAPKPTTVAGKVVDPHPEIPYWIETMGSGSAVPIKFTTTGVGPTAVVTSNIVPWGKNRGPYWSAFCMPLMGQPQPPEFVKTAPVTGGLPTFGEGSFGLGQPSAVTSNSPLAKAVDPDQGGRDMIGYNYVSECSFKVFMKNTGVVTTGR